MTRRRKLQAALAGFLSVWGAAVVVHCFKPSPRRSVADQKSSPEATPSPAPSKK